MRGDQQDRHARFFHRPLDCREPFLSGSNVSIVPGLELTIALEAGQMRKETVFPDFVLVAVAEEDGGGHGEISSSVGSLSQRTNQRLEVLQVARKEGKA